MKREKSINYLPLFSGLIALTCSVLCLSPRSSPAEEQRIAEAKVVAAKVNGKPIYEEQLQPAVESGLRKFEKRGMRETTPDLAQRLHSWALEKAIGEELILQESQRLTIEDADAKVEEKLKAARRGFATEEEFEAFLGQNNLTMESLRSSLKARVYVDEYLEREGLTEPQIPEERIRETYERNPDNYSRQETIGVSHILIAVDAAAGPEENERALREAEAIRKEILDGADFAEMAKEHSDCNSASGGGSLGYIKRGYMPEEFDKVAFAMEKDAVSEVVRTRFGYHTIKVFDKKSAGVAPYEDVRDFIEKYLQQQESEKLLEAHIAELASRAEIERFTE